MCLPKRALYNSVLLEILVIILDNSEQIERGVKMRGREQSECFLRQAALLFAEVTALPVTERLGCPGAE